MARKQQTIPGTEREVIDDVERAAEAYREVRDERCALSKREKQKKLELLAVMKANSVRRYKYDDENGEEILVSLDEKEPEVKVQRTGEADSDIGEGVPSGEGSEPAGMSGLIAEAMRAQEGDAHVEVSDDGDVEVPNTSAPKAKKGRRKKS